MEKTHTLKLAHALEWSNIAWEQESLWKSTIWRVRFNPNMTARDEVLITNIEMSTSRMIAACYCLQTVLLNFLLKRVPKTRAFSYRMIRYPIAMYFSWPLTKLWNQTYFQP